MSNGDASNTDLSRPSGNSDQKSQQTQTIEVPQDIDINAIIFKFGLDDFNSLTEEDRDMRLVSIDALEMYRAIELLNSELATMKLENYVLIEYLEKNDPRLLVGLRQRRTSILKRLQMQHQQTTKPRPSDHSASVTRSSRPSMGKRSLIASVSSGGPKRKATDQKLNYKAKAEMAEKAAAEVEKRVIDIEHNAMIEIKQLRAKIEELRFRSEETIETEKNFLLHFLRDEQDVAFLESATERQIERKLHKFTVNWFKCARALLGTMRLTIISLQESCQQHRADLITKADLSGILTAVDFEKLIIKRGELLAELEEKNNHMAGLKGVTGKTSLAMTEEKQVMMNLEAELRSVVGRTEEISRAIAKLEKETQKVEKINEKDSQTMQKLQAQLNEYEAPSVNEYIEKKEEALLLEKEEKMLQRKICILHMKLNNALHRKHRTDM